MFTHDLIKMKLVNEGYLPDYPYHLVTDKEMCYGFIHSNGEGLSGYFADNYPLLDPSLESAYNILVDAIQYHISQFLNANTDKMPDWVYAYMLGNVVSVNSDKRDIHDIISPLNADNIEDEFDAAASVACYRESCKWISKSYSSNRIIKLTDDKELDTRPPTMFGEPHIYKSIRVEGYSPVD